MHILPKKWVDTCLTRIVAIANQKGGVGKTTTALNLGLVLAQRGRRVLLVDVDPQASLTGYLGLDPYRTERSSYSLLMFPEMTLTRVLRPMRPSLALIPGSVDLATAAIKMVQEPYPLERLRHVLRTGRFPFDEVLIDTPPSLSVLSVVSLLAADEVMIPTQCNHGATQGIRAIQDVIKRIRAGMGNPDLKLRGVLPTLFDSESAYAQDVLSELRALLPGQVLETMIPYDVNVADAPHKGKAIVEYAPDSPGALAYNKLADEVLKPAVNHVLQ
jgi:chromosome partitioning protein